MTKPKTALSGYNIAMADALKQLSLARTYAEDGAPMDAIRCATSSIGHLLAAREAREMYLTETVLPTSRKREKANG